MKSMKAFGARRLIDANRAAIKAKLLLAQQDDAPRDATNNTLRRPLNVYVNNFIKPGCGCAIGVALSPKERAVVEKTETINFFDIERLMEELGYQLGGFDFKIASWTQCLHDGWNERNTPRKTFSPEIVYGDIPKPLVEYLRAQEDKVYSEETFVGWLDVVDKYISETA